MMVANIDVDGSSEAVEDDDVDGTYDVAVEDDHNRQFM